MGLSVRLQHLDVHRGVDAVEDLPGFVPAVFVTGVNGACLPVRPVQGPLGQRERERMSQGALHDRFTG